MFRRGFSVAACGALALLLTAAGSAPAQVVFFPAGRGGTGAVFGPRGGFFYPGYGYPGYGSPYYGGSPNYGSYNGYGGYGPSYGQPYGASYTTTYTAPIYYGAASMAGYSPGYTASRLVSPPAGVGLRTSDGASPADYTAPTYPVPSPNYTNIYPISPPLSMVKTDARAKVEVRVPEDAEVWFDGQTTTQTGTDRTYSSPPLEEGSNYVYEVRARWNADGKPVDQTRTIKVHAGGNAVVDFLK